MQGEPLAYVAKGPGVGFASAHGLYLTQRWGTKISIDHWSMLK